MVSGEIRKLTKLRRRAAKWNRNVLDEMVLGDVGGDTNVKVTDYVKFSESIVSRGNNDWCASLEVVLNWENDIIRGSGVTVVILSFINSTK
jgi:hypothetical protein